jgi:hypothetical protein
VPPISAPEYLLRVNGAGGPPGGKSSRRDVGLFWRQRRRHS